jgi:hypothetical protein
MKIILARRLNEGHSVTRTRKFSSLFSTDHYWPSYSIFVRSILILSYHLCLGLLSGILFRFSYHNYVFHISPIRANHQPLNLSTLNQHFMKNQNYKTYFAVFYHHLLLLKTEFCLETYAWVTYYSQITRRLLD